MTWGRIEGDPRALAAMEETLDVIGEAGIDIVPPLFERFFGEYPAQRGNFYVPEVSQGRMTNETVAILVGLAAGEGWAWVQIQNFIDLHRRNYDPIALEEYQRFVEMVVETLADAAGERWSAAQAAAWRGQAARFNDMIALEFERFGGLRPCIAG